MTNHIPLKDLVASLEAEGKAEKELEYVFYGKIENFTELDKAVGKEEQEQWEVRVNKDENHPFDGGIRVRRTGANQYTLCMKQVQEGKDAKIEVEIDATRDMFEVAKALADTGMHKTRYIFEIPNSKNVWEVDVFYNPDGTMQPWCKVDLEVKDQIDSVPPLPIAMSEVIVNQPRNRSEEEKAKIDELMKTVFLKKNAYITGAPDNPDEKQTPGQAQEAAEAAKTNADAAAAGNTASNGDGTAEGQQTQEDNEDESIPPPANRTEDPNAPKGEPTVKPAEGTNPKSPEELAAEEEAAAAADQSGTPEGGAGGPDGAEPDNAADAGQNAPANDDDEGGTSEDTNGEEDVGPNAPPSSEDDDDENPSTESFATPGDNDTVITTGDGAVPSVTGELMDVSDGYQRHMLMDLYLDGLVAVNGDESRRAALAYLVKLGYAEQADAQETYRLTQQGQAAYVTRYRLDDHIGLENYRGDLAHMLDDCSVIMASMEELSERYGYEGSTDFYEDGRWVNHDNDGVVLADDEIEAHVLADEAKELAEEIGYTKAFQDGDDVTKVSLEFVRKLSDSLSSGMEKMYNKQKHLESAIGLNHFFNRTTMDQQAEAASRNTAEAKNRKIEDRINAREQKHRDRVTAKAHKKGKEADLRRYDSSEAAADRRRRVGMHLSSR